MTYQLLRYPPPPFNTVRQLFMIKGAHTLPPGDIIFISGVGVAGLLASMVSCSYYRSGIVEASMDMCGCRRTSSVSPTN